MGHLKYKSRSVEADRKQRGRKETHFAPSEFASDLVLLLRTLRGCNMFCVSPELPRDAQRIG